jgi:hypothetical protein
MPNWLTTGWLAMFGVFVQFICATAFVGIVIYFAIRIAKYHGSGNWPLAQGHVESYGKFHHLDDHGSHLSYVDVSYSYSVNGEFYSGQWLSPTLPNDQALTEFLEQEMPIGKPVTIRYMPTHPRRSLLEDGPQPELADAPIELDI